MILTLLQMAVDTVVNLVTGRRRTAFIDADGYSLYWTDEDGEMLFIDPGQSDRWPYRPAWYREEANVAELRATGFWVVYPGRGRILPPTWGFGGGEK